MAKNATDIEMPKNAGWTFEEYTATITTTTLPGVFTAAITFDKNFAATPRRTASRTTPGGPPCRTLPPRPSTTPPAPEKEHA